MGAAPGSWVPTDIITRCELTITPRQKNDGTPSPSCVRHGTSSLFAAFNIADGTVISALHRQHRAVEFRKFLVAIDKAVPADLGVHLICDNLATHKTAAIRDWLDRHPRFHLHFTPTGSSWINQVQRWFGLLSTSSSGAGSTRASPPWSATSASGSPTGTRTRARSCGPRPRTTSSSPYRNISRRSPTQDTSAGTRSGVPRG